MPRQKQNKYRSKFEAGIAKDLENNSVRFEYEAYSYEYFAPIRGGLCNSCGNRMVVASRWYTPDFFLPKNVIVEAKGRFTSRDRSKLLRVRADHRNLDIRLLFMRDNKLHKHSKTYYSEWARKNNFPFHVGKTIPKDWYK
jgi:hypothetical protein